MSVRVLKNSERTGHGHTNTTALGRAAAAGHTPELDCSRVAVLELVSDVGMGSRTEPHSVYQGRGPGVTRRIGPSDGPVQGLEQHKF